MVAVLGGLGIAYGNIRPWDYRRSSHSPALLLEERPHWLFINQPRAMGNDKAGKHVATFQRRIALLIDAQIKHGGNFALYGSPLSLIWDVQRAPELKRCTEDWHLTELRWCNMGVVHPETGQGFGSIIKS